MKRSVLCSTLLLSFLCALTNSVYAEDSLVDQFIGSPLLILAGIIVIVAVAFVYHRIRK